MDILHFALGTATIAGCFFSYHRGWNAGSQSERQKYLPAHVNQFETEGSLKRERDEAGYDLLYRYACAVEEYNEKNPGSDLKAYDDIRIFRQFMPAFEPLLKKYPKMKICDDGITFDTPVGRFSVTKRGDIKELYILLNSTVGLGYNYEYKYVYISRSWDY